MGIEKSCLKRVDSCPGCEKRTRVCIFVYGYRTLAGPSSCMYFLDLCDHVLGLVNKTGLHFHNWCGVSG